MQSPTAKKPLAHQSATSHSPPTPLTSPGPRAVTDNTPSPPPSHRRRPDPPGSLKTGPHTSQSTDSYLRRKSWRRLHRGSPEERTESPRTFKGEDLDWRTVRGPRFYGGKRLGLIGLDWSCRVLLVSVRVLKTIDSRMDMRWRKKGKKGKKNRTNIMGFVLGSVPRIRSRKRFGSGSGHRSPGSAAPYTRAKRSSVTNISIPSSDALCD